MLSRYVVLCIALGALACEAQPKTKSGAPAAAKLVLNEKTQIRGHDGALRKSEKGELLGEQDAIAVGQGGLALVQVLQNDYLVRIDEDLELKVSELAVFGAPKAKASLKDQVEQVLTPAEQTNFSKRMAGWYASTSAADTRPARVAADEGVARPEEAKAADKDRSFGQSNQLVDRPEGGSGPPKTSPRPLEREVAPAAPVAAAEESRTSKKKGGEALAWNRSERLQDLKGCLRREIASTGSATKIGNAITIRYRKDKAGAIRLSLEGALPVPVCAAEWFEAEPPPDIGAAWKTLELDL